MSKRTPTMRELVNRAVVRKHIDIEWLSKLSCKEFRRWELNERMTLTMCKHPKYMHDELIEKQIEARELEYELTARRLSGSFSHPGKKDLNYYIDEVQRVVDGDNGVVIASNGNVNLGGELTHDIVSSPGYRDALITANTYQTTYGKVRGINTSHDMNNRHYPDNIMRWDKYEKLSKRIMTDNGYGI